MSQEAVEKRMQGVAQSFHDLITNLQITTLRKMEVNVFFNINLISKEVMSTPATRENIF